jgi:hypothetical protein
MQEVLSVEEEEEQEAEKGKEEFKDLHG